MIRLRKLREATERGHPISKLARVSDEELAGCSSTRPRRGAARAAPRESFAEQMLQAAEHYRPDDCDQALSMALALLPLPQVVDEVLVPALLEVGERWHCRRASRSRRSGSCRMRSGSRSSLVLDTYNRIASGQPIVFATLTDERHELGILMCALLAAARGVRCQYLGADVPPADVALFADASAPRRWCCRSCAASRAPRPRRCSPSSSGACHAASRCGSAARVRRHSSSPASAERVVVLGDFRALERELDALAAAGR